MGGLVVDVLPPRRVPGPVTAPPRLRRLGEELRVPGQVTPPPRFRRLLFTPGRTPRAPSPACRSFVALFALLLFGFEQFVFVFVVAFILLDLSFYSIFFVMMVHLDEAGCV